jgi:hypothetical protein
MLLYLVKHSRFEIANSVRELSEETDIATMAYQKLLLCNIKYVIITDYLALKLKPNANKYNFLGEGTPTEDTRLALAVKTNSKFVADPDLRISVLDIAFISVKQ